MAEWEIQKLFTFTIFKKLTEMPPTNCEIHGKNFKDFKNFCKGIATMFGERRNASCFVIFRINHFQKNKHRKENTTS